jgi:hypothetical protein
VGYKKISVKKAYWLERPVSMEETKESIWDCDGSKSSRPDGFNFKFFRKVWNFICYDLYDMMNEFFQSGKLSKGVNDPCVTLIPTKKHKWNSCITNLLAW